MLENNETNVLINENVELLNALENYFSKLWTGEARKPNVFPEAPGKDNAQIYTDGSYKSLILSMIRRARTSIDFSMYYFYDEEIEGALIGAHLRGVKVRGYVNQYEKVALESVDRNRKSVENLRKVGLKEIYFNLNSFFAHSKWIAVDGQELAVGTGNWSKSDVKKHPQLYVYILDSHLSQNISRHLTQQIAYESDRVKLKRLYHRFWIGWKRPELELKEFDGAIDKAFVDATVQTGLGRGLHSYQPVLIAENSNAALPHEVALVTYTEEKARQAIMESQLGREYGPLHGEYFLMERGNPNNSYSTVPETFLGIVNIGKAYDISRLDTNWQTEESYFLLIERKASQNDEDYLERVSERLKNIADNRESFGISGYLVLVHKDFTAEYFSTKTETDFGRMLQKLRALGSSKRIHAQKVVKQKLGETKIVRGQELGAISPIFSQELNLQLIMATSAADLEKTQNAQELKQAEIRKNMKDGTLQIFLDCKLEVDHK